jgi:hypothetical protein
MFIYLVYTIISLLNHKAKQTKDVLLAILSKAMVSVSFLLFHFYLFYKNQTPPQYFYLLLLNTKRVLFLCGKSKLHIVQAETFCLFILFCVAGKGFSIKAVQYCFSCTHPNSASFIFQNCPNTFIE